MKVYVVWEYAVIEYEECFRNMGVFSSEEKAKAAVKEYEEIAVAYTGHFEYNYEEFELDTVWESIGDVEEDDEKEYMLIDMDDTKVNCTTPTKESAATEDFFSADEVRKMSQEEVRKNYDKILKSMSYWK